ncbi:MAG TPA: ABC transporter permease [Anaerolineae bacterium]
MKSYLLLRLVRLILVWLGVSLITFLLLRLTGDPARLVLGDFASDKAIQQYRAEHGLDRSWPEQYLTFIGGVLQGDFGRSLRYEAPILPIILERVPASAELAGASLLISIVFGVSLGVVAALRRDTAIDFIARGIVLIAQGIPNFFLAILLVILFGVQLHWLPTGGTGTWQHLVLPSIVLSFVLMPLTLRVTRSAMLDIVAQNYVRTARAKGLAENVILLRHVLRNAALPIITILGVQTATLLSGSIVTETIFSWPGIGRLIVSAITGRDFPLVQASVLIIATAVVIVNFLVDLVYGILDPRISIR